MKAVAALRNQFGGHAVSRKIFFFKKKKKKNEKD